MALTFRTIDDFDPAGRRVLLRADLNVPLRDGRITDLTRIERVSPTISDLAARGGRVIVLSHFDRPKGKRVASMSLAPVAEALGAVLGTTVRFCADCIGPDAEHAAAALAPGEVLLLENTRFHPGEEANDPEFARALSALGEVYVNDAFSAAHRAHASTEGIARFLPAYAGRLMQAELSALEAALGDPQRPAGAIVGGAKVSTKLDLLDNLIRRVDLLVIGGAMANTFVAAEGMSVGRSLEEPGLHDSARAIMQAASAAGCRILLPMDFVVSETFAPNPPVDTVPANAIPAGSMALDVGPKTVEAILGAVEDMKTLTWNGPLGAFETPPFDRATRAVAEAVAAATAKGLVSVAGGGDTVSALRQAGVLDRLTYVSTAGGAFLEWMEGKTLPGVEVLLAH